jgi:hypothetical protein
MLLQKMFFAFICVKDLDQDHTEDPENGYDNSG